MNFFGREQEIGELMALWGKRSGSLVTCRGRRRIGKSTLIEVFAHKSKARFIRIEGGDVRVRPHWWSKSGGVTEYLVNCSPCDAQGTFKRTDATT